MRFWWLQIGRFAAPHAGGLAQIVALMLVAVALDVLKPWPLKLIVDYALQGRPLPSNSDWIAALSGGEGGAKLLIWLAAATFALFAAAEGIRLVQSYIQSAVGNRMVYDLGARLFDHIQRMCLSFHGRQQTGDLLKRVTADTSCVRDLVLWVFLSSLTSIVTIVAMFSVMWTLDPVLAVLALLVVPPLGVLIRVFARRIAGSSYDYENCSGQVMAMAEQSLTALPLVQVFGRERLEDRRFNALAERTVSSYVGAMISQLQFKVGTSAVTAIGTATILIVGGFHVLEGVLTLGGLLIFLTYLAALYAPVESLMYLSSGFAQAAARARRVLEVLRLENVIRESPAAIGLPTSHDSAGAHVRFEHVTFGHEAGRPVLHDICLEARPGETIALVGPTGAGKSTLMSLIPRFFDPWTGRITIDGVDLRDLQLASLRAGVSLVLQEPSLLPLTVAENISYGSHDAHRADIIAAAAAANADAFVRHLPEGYDTVLGERGASLSGGEQQRLSIARALFKRAPVLILDEPTSALDTGTESDILEALERLKRGKTTFVIAHRLSTVRHATRIAVLDAGRIVEVGTHGELMAAGGAYRRLYDLQFP